VSTIAATIQHLRPGFVVGGKYRVERVLGTGGMAVVVEATHVTLGRRVAIKVLQGDSSRAADVASRFHREAQIAAQLPGEHIARVSDVGITEAGEPYLVMELLVGRDLDAELRARGALPVTEAVDYLLQACEGVAEAHAAGLVHRDLKPGNLFLTRRRDGTPVIKVLDFGISKAAPGQGDQSLTKTTSTFGTPLYMSPEQVQSAKHVDGRSDQHALGAILYALLTGSPPYQGESLTALAVIIATQAPRPIREQRAEIPPPLEAAVFRALAKSPAHRFPDLAGFAAAIAPFGGPESPARVRCIMDALAPPMPGREPISRVVQLSAAPAASQPLPEINPLEADQPRRRFLRLTAVATMVTVVVGLVVVVWVRGGPASDSDVPGAEVNAATDAPTTAPSGTATATPSVPQAAPPPPVATSAPASAPSATAPPKAPSATARPTATAAHPVAPSPRPPAGKKKKPPTPTATSDPTDVFSTRR
jgi:serine/threonine-protein kinase